MSESVGERESERARARADRIERGHKQDQHELRAQAPTGTDTSIRRQPLHAAPPVYTLGRNNLGPLHAVTYPPGRAAAKSRLGPMGLIDPSCSAAWHPVDSPLPPPLPTFGRLKGKGGVMRGWVWERREGGEGGVKKLRFSSQGFNSYVVRNVWFRVRQSLV